MAKNKNRYTRDVVVRIHDPKFKRISKVSIAINILLAISLVISLYV